MFIVGGLLKRTCVGDEVSAKQLGWGARRRYNLRQNKCQSQWLRRTPRQWGLAMQVHGQWPMHSAERGAASAPPTPGKAFHQSICDAKN
jgi:hypothetical protein